MWLCSKHYHEGFLPIWMQCLHLAMEPFVLNWDWENESWAFHLLQEAHWMLSSSFSSSPLSLRIVVPQPTKNCFIWSASSTSVSCWINERHDLLESIRCTNCLGRLMSLQSLQLRHANWCWVWLAACESPINPHGHERCDLRLQQRFANCLWHSCDYEKCDCG